MVRLRCESRVFLLKKNKTTHGGKFNSFPSASIDAVSSLDTIVCCAVFPLSISGPDDPPTLLFLFHRDDLPTSSRPVLRPFGVDRLRDDRPHPSQG
jgi:hypothetical protein